ncbi:MAG: hypothetical protein JKX97_01340, partial [Candidatus Lindowbacteria bacterium]|nr:hypothetical protein [Candidatus Lindowbacteria bacterium]
MKTSPFNFSEGKLVDSTKSEFWGLPLFLALFSVTFTLLVFLVTIYGSLGANILPFAAVFTFLSAIFWILDPILKERFSPIVSSVFLIAVYLVSAQVLILASGGMNSPFFLVYYFVMFTAAMAYGLTGAIAITALIAIAYATFIESELYLPIYLTNIIILWIISLMVGFLAETKKRVERREALQNMRLSALEEVTHFMRELSAPHDVLETGLDATLRLLNADGVFLVSENGVIFKKVADDKRDFPPEGEKFDLTMEGKTYIFVVRRRAPILASEKRLVGLLLDKIA